jgi:hypothetical protein
MTCVAQPTFFRRDGGSEFFCDNFLAAALADWSSILRSDKRHREALLKVRVPAAVTSQSTSVLQTLYHHCVIHPCSGRDGSTPFEHGLPLLPMPDQRDHTKAHTTQRQEEPTRRHITARARRTCHCPRGWRKRRFRSRRIQVSHRHRKAVEDTNTTGRCSRGSTRPRGHGQSEGEAS